MVSGDLGSYLKFPNPRSALELAPVRVLPPFIRYVDSAQGKT